MLFFLTYRLISSVAVFLYPGYASYKTLSQRPASEEDLERWLMYWSVLGCIVSVEYVAEWLLCWIPFYYAMKTLLLLYLALPQTRGSTFIYVNHLHPFFRTHERQIDEALAKFRAYVYAALQRQVKLLWEHIGASVGAPQQQEQAQQPDPPASGLGGVVDGLWRTYGPGILAGGAALLRPQPQPAASAAIDMNSPAGIPSGSMFAAPTTESVLERRRRLEAELAALPPVAGSSMPTTPPSPTTTFSRNSSGADLVHRGAGIRERTDSNAGGRFTFEEVEAPAEGEGYDTRPPAVQRASWFGWGGGAGYQHIKDD
ncbi:TB2/DP1, HVA22 family-domain-containing protein [Roridomyces roridus]|uniref:Protein YOP1 n=1 Tax=Roridomyces roridus TaxID=1738132 RepID=A0AAD7BRP3_9AGAR|nr:TB2/DP1, HVA22 family-domain-containing protein [Roridomyces roridus]